MRVVAQTVPQAGTDVKGSYPAKAALSAGSRRELAHVHYVLDPSR
ncbi:hypothetical protein [Streptomyces jumonjinensis]|nr:hypothetical protein [Streptomyces jumonjinensis]